MLKGITQMVLGVICEAVAKLEAGIVRPFDGLNDFQQ